MTKWINTLISHCTSSTAAQPGRLSGWKVIAKDNLNYGKTTCASQMLSAYCSPIQATVLSLLLRSGAQIIAKSNLDEFGMGSSNTHSFFGTTCQEDRSGRKRSVGGSSGGSAAAVASSQCRVALGTDTGGSIRLPAAHCGVVGFKPSYGLLSRWGVVAYASSLDTVGILAKNVHDALTTFECLNQYDPQDPTAVPSEYRKRAAHFVDAKLSDKSKLRIGIPIEAFPVECTPQANQAVRSAVDQFRLHGATIVPVSLPSIPLVLSAYYVISSAEAASNLARYDGMQYGYKTSENIEALDSAQLCARNRTLALGNEVKKRILIGNHALNADAYQNYFLQAQTIRRQLRDDFNNVFAMPHVLDSVLAPESFQASVDVILCPTAIGDPPFLSDLAADDDEPLKEYMQDVLTVPASLAGLPAISVPTESKDGQSIQLVGQWGSDRLVCHAASLLHQSLCY